MKKSLTASCTSINIVDLSDAFTDWYNLESGQGKAPDLDLWRSAFDSVIAEKGFSSRGFCHGEVTVARLIILKAFREALRFIPAQGKLHGHFAVVKCQEQSNHGQT